MHSPSAEPYGEDMAHVQIIDDDSTVRGVVADYLTAAGHRVSQAANGETGLEQARSAKPDLIVLDLMLPGLDGLEVFRRLRHEGLSVPVIMLTAKDSEADRILGLELGADDYLTKPFSPRELVLRVQSVLRRGPVVADAQPRQVITDGELVLDLTSRKASLAGETLPLTLREFDLLAQLVSHPDQVFSREELMGAVWGWEFGDASTVTVHVRRLRGKVEADPSAPRRLVTVWGRGYRWEPEADR